MQPKTNPHDRHIQNIPDRVQKRALERVEKRDDGCWISSYARTTTGYAALGYREDGRDRMVLAHRAAWTAYFGSIPDGMVVDHLCFERACVNPAHLRLLTLAQNSQRKGGRDFPLGQCPNGHPDSAMREVIWAGRRRRTCGDCMREKNERNNAKRKARLDAARAARHAAARMGAAG